ncbi:hypothetical protein N7526_002547 [Penicillium atrosanguineum]|nr:hypothetical protein N7526_002547 [Penicillium atrosanguineum]
MKTISTLWELDTTERANNYLTNNAGSSFCVQNFIDNEFTENTQTEDWIDTFNPSTGEVLARIHRSAASDVNRAVDAASKAFPSWSRTTRQERADMLLRIASILDEKKELFAVWESIDQGKTLARARVEVDRAIANFRQATLPPGVMNIIFGDGSGAGSTLVKSPYVRGVSFTGGTSTGIRIRQDTVADIGKHLSLELGGKNPTLIFDDVDLAKAVALAAQASFENSGQICLCGSRIYVHRDIYERFLPAFAEYVHKNYRCGETIGPVVSREHYSKVRSYLRLAQDEKAHFHTGEVPDEDPHNGYWIKPTVLSGVCTDSRVMREEIFGPVVTVSPFDTEKEAIELANDNPNGLASVLMTTDISRMRRVGEQIEAGLVWVNCWLVRELGTAFGGMKASGIGREGGAQSRDVFTNLRTLHVR